MVESRTALGGEAHGRSIVALYGSRVFHAPSGTTYRKFGAQYWVPDSDTDDAAVARVNEYEFRGRSLPAPSTK